MQLDGWRTCWYIFAAYASVVGVLFMIIFKDDKKNNISDKEIKAAEMSEETI